MGSAMTTLSHNIFCISDYAKQANIEKKDYMYTTAYTLTRGLLSEDGAGEHRVVPLVPAKVDLTG